VKKPERDYLEVICEIFYLQVSKVITLDFLNFVSVAILTFCYGYNLFFVKCEPDSITGSPLSKGEQTNLFVPKRLGF
jgi:hypothetical protein